MNMIRDKKYMHLEETWCYSLLKWNIEELIQCTNHFWDLWLKKSIWDIIYV